MKKLIAGPKVYICDKCVDICLDIISNDRRCQLGVRREELDSPVAVALITALNAELAAMYNDPTANHFTLDLADVAPGNGAFLVAYVDGQPVGCGAIRRLDERTAEIKRMYVVPEWRGRGVSKNVLQALEDEARGLGIARLVLETGNRQKSALALYRNSGFKEIPLFGEYVHSPATSVCMAKDLR